ncbi:MAG: purine-nucleoside phosphorylase [Actinobacteria bacterium]|nr:purine-nucleoside phosphorylase [Actinomycetota bacterium]
MTYNALQQAAAAIAYRTGRQSHDAAIVLGSGLSSFGASLNDAQAIPFSEIPGFPIPKVAGHGGTLYSAPVGDKTILILSGRVHLYEGWQLSDVVFGVRAAALTGVKTVLLTNASGGCGEGLEPGDLVVVTDHINFTGRNPLTGANDDRLGPRFPDMSTLYDSSLRSRIGQAMQEHGVTYKEGVYGWFLGPSYETPAEVQMARTLGTDLVGMSTVPEAIALRHMGVRVGAISLVTNLAAGISKQPLSHADVTETAAHAKETFTAVLTSLLPALVE